MNPFDYRTTESAAERTFTVWADTRKAALLGLLIVAFGTVVAAIIEVFAPGNLALVLVLSALAGVSYFLLIRAQQQVIIVRDEVIFGTSLDVGAGGALEVPRELVERVLFGSSQRLRVLAIQGRTELYVVCTLPLPADRLRSLANALAAALGVPAEERTLAELWPRRRR